ncbi:jg21451, partial [Pararge aegeria aegeria]
GKPGEPFATLTPLGWCLHGCTRTQSVNCLLHSTLLLSSNHCGLDTEKEDLLREIHEEVRRSFAIDSLGVTAKPRGNSDDLRAQAHLEKTCKLIQGRWYVGLPWRDSNAKMPNSFTYAMSRLKGIEKKVKADVGYASRYKERIEHLFQNNYAKQVVDISWSPRTWYLPHFGVDNPNKKKLRLVFDAAAKFQNVSLNDYLLKGPDLLVSLLGIMMRFREHRIGITGDIKDMFLRIKILPEDQDALRFLWRDTPKDKLKVCAMTSLIFGANCSPFIAQFIKNKNAQRYESSKPAAVKAILQQHYMDDYIDSVDSIETARQLIKEVTFIHGQGGFEIRNWTSNFKEVLSYIPTEALGPTAVRFDIEQHSERTLGLMWFPKQDTLGFDVSFKRIPTNIVAGEKIPTKREMLRVIMSIFDVFGFLSPFTIRGKIILQETWQSGIGWDESLTDELYIKWTEWLKSLKGISQISLPRHYLAAARASEMEDAPSALNSGGSGVYNKLALHVFSDASTKAMCAVAYWRWERNDKIYVAFIASKCKVAPIKQSLSVPRLELQAAVLAARLADTIVTQHKIKPRNKYFWSDSTTVLHWIRNDARNYQTFVAHRL